MGRKTAALLNWGPRRRKGRQGNLGGRGPALREIRRAWPIRDTCRGRNGMREAETTMKLKREARPQLPHGSTQNKVCRNPQGNRVTGDFHSPE